MWSQLIPPTLRGYRLAWLGADAVAGVTLVAVALPSQIATARLANLAPAAGIYAFVAGSLLYALVGTERHLSVGADSTIAPVMATGVASIVALGSAGYVDLMAFTALFVGVLVMAVGLLRLGWVSEFLSTPVIAGILAGIAVEIVVRQLPAIFGVSSAGSTTMGRLRSLFQQLSHANGWTIGIAVMVLAVILLSQRVNRRIPGPLLALVLSVAAVVAFKLASHHGVALLGAVHGGLPHLRLPSISWSQLRQLVTLALTVTFVCVAQTAAAVRASNAGAPAATSFNRDLIGVGAGSVVAGLIGSFAVDASPPNSAVALSAGARSQLTNLFAALVAVVVVWVATAPLTHLPKATLAATLVFIATKLLRVGELRSIYRFDRLEFGLAAAAFLVVALIGIEQGILLAMILSLADRTRRSARPQDAVLGREPGTDHWIPDDIGRPTEQLPGVLVYLVYAPLWYGNADYLRLRIDHLVQSSPGPVHALILDADAISDIDYTGLHALADLSAELSTQGVALCIARASHLVHHDLKHGALLGKIGPPLFASVEEAAEAMQGLPTGEKNPPGPSRQLGSSR